MREPIHLISTQDTKSMVTEMVELLKAELWDIITHENHVYAEHNNEETKVVLDQSLRGKHVYVIADVNGKQSVPDLVVKYNDRLLQLLLLTQNAKIHGAKTINVIPTCFPYSRQDKPVQWWLKERVAREPAATQLVVDMFQGLLNTDYCITIDVHNPATINNSKETKFVNLYTWWHVQQVLERLKTESAIQSPILSGTDEWWLKKVNAIAKDLGLKHLTVLKQRDYSQPGTVDEISVYGDFAGKDVLIMDDILDTWWSLIKLIKKLNSLPVELRPKSINICVTHGMFNKDAIEKLTELHEQWMFQHIFVTDSVCRETYPPFVKVTSVAPIFANTIKDLAIGKDINYNYGAKPVPKPEQKT